MSAKQVLYVLWQWTWGFAQTLAGAVIFLIFWRCPHFRYQGAVVTVWPIKSGSMSVGGFLFLHPGWQPGNQKLLAHEYGHTVQSLILGPLYLFVIGIPSFLWALPPATRWRARHKIPYSALYTERWADRNGARFAKKPNLRRTSDGKIRREPA